MGDVQAFDSGLKRKLQSKINIAVRDVKEHWSKHGIDNAIARARTHLPGKYDPHGEPEGTVLEPNEFHPSYHASTVILCKDIADKLVTLYPGWQWGVQPDENGEVINIFNFDCHDAFGYTIRMVEIMDDPNRKEAMRAGGEILKRFGFPAKGKDPELVKAAPRDMKGRVIPDLSGVPVSNSMKRDADIMGKLRTGELEMVKVGDKLFLKKTR